MVNVQGNIQLSFQIISLCCIVHAMKLNQSNFSLSCPKPVEMNTKYYIFSKCTSLFHPTNLQIFMCHTFCATLCHLFCCATLYIVNVPHFCLICHMFQTICSMFYTLSITLFTFLKTLLYQHGYLSFKHLVVLKRTWI